MEIIALRSRPAEQLEPVLRPLLAPGETLVSFNDRLVVRASPATLARIHEVLEQLDTPARRLLITVREGRVDESERAGAQVSGRVEVPDGAVVIGEPGRRQQGVEARVWSSNDARRERSSRSVQTVEGGQAWIQVGTRLPLALRSTVVGPGGVLRSEGVQYVDVSSGFYARPQLAGDTVTLEIRPQQQRVGSGGRIESAGLSTTVSGRVGEWLRLGGGATAQSERQGGGLRYGGGSVTRDDEVWVKVEVLD